MLIAPQPYAALVTVTACAAEAGAPCVVVDDAGTGGIRGYDPADERVRRIPELFDPYDVYHRPHESALKGEVQLDNTRLAVAAALFLRKQRVNIPDDAIATGLQQVVWPGRFEFSADRTRPCVV
jgi:folylpolyglutamate synthase/dihydropteroate synthase